jgi:uncharacterized protein
VSLASKTSLILGSLRILVHSWQDEMKKVNLYIPPEKIVEFCKANRIRRLALFGSVLREDFSPFSDVDVLVEFEAGARVGMIRLSAMEAELSQILGRNVDLNTSGFLSKYYRERILSEAEVQYDAA